LIDGVTDPLSNRRHNKKFSREEIMKRLAGAVLVCIVLSGCVTVTRAPLPTTQAPSPNEGIVVVSVTTNSGQVNQFDSIHLVRVQDAGKSDTGVVAQYILEQVSKGLARDTALFVGVLPAGEYEFQKFSDDDTRKFLALKEKSREALGAIRVRAGTLSDLGRIVVTQVNVNVMVGRSANARSNKELLGRVAPTMTKYYEGPTDAGWVRALGSNDLAEKYALHYPVGAQALVELPSGETAAATRMGTVLLRSTQGRWQRISSGKPESILWIAPYESDGSRLLAAGEFNTLLRLDRSGKLHPVETGNLPFGNMIFFDGNASAGWYAALQRGTDISLYHSPTMPPTNWKLLRSETVGKDFWNGQSQFWAWRTTGGFAYAVSDGRIEHYDYATQKWSETRAPNGHRFIRVEPSAEDTIGILTSPGGGVGGVFASTYYSRDFGKTWIETKSPFTVKASAPKRTPQGALLETGGVFSEISMQGSKDGGKTWGPVVTGKRGLLTDQLWVLPSGRMFLVGSTFGIENIEVSADGGANWKLEYSTFERSIYEKQKAK